MAANDVNEIQTASQALMQTQYDAVSEFIAFLREEAQVTEPAYTEPPLDLDELSNFILNGYITDLRSFRPDEDLTPVAPDLGEAPSIETLVEIDVPSIDAPANFTGTRVAYTAPDTPAALSATAPVAPQDPRDARQIAVPTISALTVPSFSAIAMPGALGLDMPSFTATAPAYDLTAPTESFVFAEQEYASALSDSLKAKLLEDMENGSYGIESSDEAALWTRTRERAATEANAKTEEVLRVAASRGFSLPSGADLAAIEAAQQAALASISGVNREIALKRADMYVEGRKVTMSLAREVEQMFISYRSSMMDRALKAAQSLVELSVSIFTSKVQAFNARLDAYKTYAQVFGEQIRAQSLKIELFKGQLEAAKLQGDMNRDQLALYIAQLQGQKVAVELYTAQMDGVKVEQDVERTKLEIFRTRMEAYATQVQAKTAEFGLYEAKVKGELAKIEGFKADVAGYLAQVESVNAKSKSSEARLRAQLASNEAKAERYKQNLTNYKTRLDSNLHHYELDRKHFQDVLLRWKTDVDGALHLHNSVMKIAEQNVAIRSKRIDRDIGRTDASVTRLLAVMKHRLDASNMGADATSKLAVAAAQQIVGLTQLLKEG